MGEKVYTHGEGEVLVESWSVGRSLAAIGFGSAAVGLVGLGPVASAKHSPGTTMSSPGVVDRSELSDDERRYLQLVGSLGLPMSDEIALSLRRGTVGGLIDRATAAGLTIPESIVELDRSAAVTDAMSALDALPLFEQLVPERSPAPATVEYLVSEVGLDRDTAAAWAERSVQLQRLAVVLAYEYPDFWAGASFDHARQVLVVATADDDEAFGLREAVRLEPDVEVRLVRHTMAHIRADIDAVSLALGLNATSLDWADLTPEQKYITVAEDFDLNGIVVTVDPTLVGYETVAERSRAVVSTPLNVMIAEAEGQLACLPLACPPPLRAGIKEGATGCTFGFTMTNGEPTWRTSTAGHCGGQDVGAGRSHNGSFVGSVVWESTADMGIDVELVTVDNYGYWQPSAAYYRDAEWSVHVEGTMSQADAAYETILCHTGVGSYAAWGYATSCGPLRAKYATFAGNVNSVGRFDGCSAAGGDSGGPVFGNSDHLAYGFFKGWDAPPGLLRCFFSWASLVEYWSNWRPAK